MGHPETYRARVLSGLDSDALPRLATLAPRWPELTARVSYASGLRARVYGLLAG